MKENTFYILLSIRTSNGFESFGKFSVGNNRKAAAAVFSQLKGNAVVDEKTILTIDLVETVNDLPLNLQILANTLDELTYNCKIITKETFKRLNLKHI
jgi:hypothetical protein